MKGDDIAARLVALAVRVVKIVDALPDTLAGRHVAGQVLRSGTSRFPRSTHCAAYWGHRSGPPASIARRLRAGTPRRADDRFPVSGFLFAVFRLLHPASCRSIPPLCPSRGPISISCAPARGRRLRRHRTACGRVLYAPEINAPGPLHAHLEDFDLHGAVAVPAGDRDRLEH